MERKRSRIMITVVAVSFAVGVVLILSYAGKKSKGPIEDFFSGAGEAVQQVEQDLIIKKRVSKRADKLIWFNQYKENIDLLREPKTILIGAFDNQNTTSFASSINLEDTLKTTFPLIQIYTAWGSKTDQQFPEIKVKTIFNMGSVPVITWEPWLSDFDAEKFTNLREPDKRDVKGMRDIARGKYDAYIIKWAKAAAKINQPFYLRFGHEMNDPYRYPWGPHNNTAKEFISAWIHVYNIFKKEGADKIIWIYSPHPAYGFFDAFYPGSDYVDFVGVGALNYGTVANWSKWWTFEEIFGKYYKDLAQFNKPIMISEFGCLAYGGKRDIWFAEALRDMPIKYPMVKSVLFFHFSDDKTTTQQSLNWYFIRDEKTVKAIVTEMQNWGGGS